MDLQHIAGSERTACSAGMCLNIQLGTGMTVRWQPAGSHAYKTECTATVCTVEGICVPLRIMASLSELEHRTSSYS